VFLALLLPACIDLSGLAFPRFEFDPATCAELRASDFFWSLRGFGSEDILDPDVRNQTQLTAIMRVGQTKILELRAATVQTQEDCRSKAVSVEWSSSRPRVVRLDFARDRLTATLTALKPGDAEVAATLQFEDGTPMLRALPWSFTNVGSGDITVVRVVP
jgi:hypothetical protein